MCLDERKHVRSQQNSSHTIQNGTCVELPAGSPDAAVEHGKIYDVVGFRL